MNNDLGACGATVTYSVTSTDNCPGQTVAQTAGLASGSVFPIGTTTNTFVVTDASGNTATCSFNVVVTDNELPTITCPGNFNVNNDLGACGATVTYSVTSTDNCPGQTVAQTAGLASGSVFPIGTTTNTFVVTDASGNTATCSFNVVVTDNELPTITCPGNVSVNNDLGACGATVTYSVTSTDNCPGQTVAQTAGLASGSVFPIGTTTNTFVVTDASGNTATCSFNVVVTDNELPTITCPGNFNVNNDLGVCGATVTYSVTSTDNCPGQTVAQTAGLASGSVFPIGTTTNTFVVTDASGNTATCSFNVVVTDNELPTITCPGNVSVNNDLGACGATVTYSVTSTDNCPGQTVAQTAGLASGSVFPIGTTTNTFVVTDASGNTATCSFNVVVTDNELPTITCPGNINVNNDLGVCGATVTYSVTSTDNCPGQTVAQTAGLASGSVFPMGTTTNTFVVTDASGNTATCSFDVVVSDNELPTITCPGNINVNNDLGACGATVTYSVTSTDNCPGQTVAQTAGLASGSVFPIGTTTNTFVVTDAAGNTATCSFNVVVTDNELPTITCPGNINVNNDLGVCGATVTYSVTSTDNCPGQTVAQTAGLASGSVFPIGTTTNTFVVTDASGNTATCSFNVVVADTELPTITCPAKIVLCGSQVVNYSAPSSTDNCPGQTVTQTAGQASGTVFPVGTTTNTFVVTDASGNTATCSFDVVINPIPANAVATPSSQIVCSGAPITTIVLSGSVPGTVYNWTRDNTASIIGMAASGTGDITGSLINTTFANVLVTFTITPTYTNDGVTCTGTPITATVTVRAASDGSITGAANLTICAGTNGSVNLFLNGTGVFSAVFNIAEEITPGVFGAGVSYGPVTFNTPGAKTLAVPAAQIPNTSSTTKKYRISWVSMTDGNGCVSDPLDGFVVLTVSPLPVINVSAAPSGNLCPGTLITFDVTETNSVGGTFNWVARDAGNVIIGSASNVAYGSNAVSTTLAPTGLTCTVNNPVTFTFTPFSAAPCQGTALTRVVTIKDDTAPVVSAPTTSDLECESDLTCSTNNNSRLQCPSGSIVQR